MVPHRGIEYPTFPSEGRHIRTLLLHAGEVRDPISCTLHVLDLDSQPAYDALSYTWGDPGVTESIQVGGIAVEVTLNLYTALRHLRHTSDDLVLWVDAVCINQSDNEEKSQQVAMMGDIYRQCAQVRIWLGCKPGECGLGRSMRRVDSVMDEPDQQADPFELIRHLAEDRHIHEWPCFNADGQQGGFVYRESKAFNGMWEEFLTVAQSTWWSRMWTVQEVILPRSGTLTYDVWSASLVDITKCGTNYYSHVWGCCKDIMPHMPSSISIALDEFCTTFLTLDRDRNSLAEDEYFDLQEQHVSYALRQCQNPRDKVYGLLGLIGDISELDLWLTPNYSNSKDEVYYDATCAMLYRGRRDLKCLVGVEYGHRPGTRKWASWVRDFDAQLTQLDADVESNRLMMYDLFNASDGRKASYEQYMTHPQMAEEMPYQVGLGLTGKCVGSVASMYDEIREGGSDEDKVRQIHAYTQWAQASMGIDLATLDLDQLDGSQQQQQQSDAGEKFLRTIFAGVASTGRDEEYSDWRRFTHENVVWLKSFVSWIRNEVEDMSFALGRTLLHALHGRCYFRTETQGQGLCYPTARPGDEIWVIYGSKVPLILRRVGLSEEESRELRPMDAYGVNTDGEYGVKEDFEPDVEPRGYYELVGDCYLDEFMDGEAIHDASLLEAFIVVV
ncbi:Nn.00g032340.m01.CDS01 [Neocucurbitaria sp. VM-36]